MRNLAVKILPVIQKFYKIINRNIELFYWFFTWASIADLDSAHVVIEFVTVIFIY